MSDELKVGYGRFDPNPQPLTPGQSKILDALKALPLATFAERREAEIATLRTQLAAMTAERDELQTSMDELRKACAEVIGADPQTWPDHGNAPLAIAASLGLRSIELDRATAERDNWKETSVTIAGELADTKDERDAAMAKVVVLRDALVESVDQMIGDAMSIEWECGDCRMLEKMEADHDLSPAIYLARNALEATK